MLWNFRTSHFTFHVNTGTHAHFSWLLWCHRRTIFGSTKNIQSKVLYRTISSLSFYNLKNLFSPQRTFCETERFLRLTFGQKGYSMASWSTFIFKSVLDKHNNCASTEISVRQGNLIYYKLKDNKTKHVLHFRRTNYFDLKILCYLKVVMRDIRLA